MLQVRRADERGHSQLSWLDSRFTFSFAEYHDPAHMGFRTLRVINDDHIAAGGGFGTHGHRDMEILTYVLAGQLEHKDSLGNGSIIQPGEIQRMSAGRGIQHSEFNHSKTTAVHLLQIWILPSQAGLDPSYEQKPIDLDDGRLHLLASPNGKGVVTIHQDAHVYAARPRTKQSAIHVLAKGRFAWLQIARGSVGVDGQILSAGDGASFAGPQDIVIDAMADSEFLLFDLA